MSSLYVVDSNGVVMPADQPLIDVSNMNWFTPEYQQTQKINSDIPRVNSKNKENALSYYALRHQFDTNQPSAPTNLPQPPLYIHIDTSTGVQTPGPEPVVPPLPYIPNRPDPHTPIAMDPSKDEPAQVLAGLAMLLPIIQKIAADLAAVKAKVGA